jgi:Uma2 family endonuclease
MRMPQRQEDQRGSDDKPNALPRLSGSGGGRRWNGYPTSDGKPMAETDWHRDLMLIIIETLRAFYAGKRVYVSGNLLVFYQPGNRRRHVSPDVFVVRGVENYQRPNYLIWGEQRSPEVVIELTSSSTRREDLHTKMTLYQNTLCVREYFLFDPFAEWLDPPLQGYRLRQGAYQRMRPRHGRLVSQVLTLHLERDGQMLRLWDPRTGAWLPTPSERLQLEARAHEEAEQRAGDAERRAHDAERRVQDAEQRAEKEVQARAQAEADRERMRQENEELRRRLGETQ